jgi:NET1-associated nuclear protein 1 (U3 small nucleolar RNA-associated protein 17)
LSVENTKEAEKESTKVLRGQIKKCNLTDFRMAGGVTLTEVKKKKLNCIFFINNVCVITFL